MKELLHIPTGNYVRFEKEDLDIRTYIAECCVEEFVLYRQTLPKTTHQRIFSSYEDLINDIITMQGWRWHLENVCHIEWRNNFQVSEFAIVDTNE